MLQITLYLTTLTLMIVAEDKPNTVSISPGSPSTELKSNTIQKLITILGNFGLDDQRGLKKVYLSNRTITCNDGSQAGFYLRKSHGSKRWIMFLDGGWYCYDNRTCRSRWMRVRHLMTSTQWPETRDGESSIIYNYMCAANNRFSASSIWAPKLAYRNFFYSFHLFVHGCFSFSGRDTIDASQWESTFLARESCVGIVRLVIDLTSTHRIFP